MDCTLILILAAFGGGSFGVAGGIFITWRACKPLMTEAFARADEAEQALEEIRG